MPRVSLVMLFLVLVVQGEGLAEIQAADCQTSPELIVDVDINDEVWLRDHAMTETDVKALVANLKQNGCQTLIVRCGCLGLLPYRTDLSYPVGFDAQHARTNPAPAVIADMEAYIAERTIWNQRYAEVIRDINPPAAFIRAGHEQGMKVIAWIDIFDDSFPGYRSKFLDEHPHCQWVGKDGQTYFKGLMDYSWPEARAFRVAQARELLDLGADGIDCSTSAHCRHLPNTHEEDFYGYSQPIVNAFQAQYGVDIRTAEDFDKAAWHDLKGQSMVQLYRDLAQLCHDRGKQLWIGLQFGRYTQFAVDGYFSTNVVARYTNHWKILVDEGLADAFILGDYEPMGEPDIAYWTTKTDIRRREGEDLYAWAAREYQAYCRDKTRLYLWGYAAPAMVVKYRFDGIDIHEAWDYESENGWMRLRSIADLFKGQIPSP
ncbi:MAG: glycoside hydrolase family 10 protein [Pirellulaceae bacterium]